MTKQEKIAKGEHARRLLEDELLQEAFATVERDIFEEWRASNLQDYEQRSELFLTLRALERLKARLRATLDDGVIASRT